MDDNSIIQTELAWLERNGYSAEEIQRIVANYSGYHAWQSLTGNQRRRLAADLRRHTEIARRWRYALTGMLQ
jgi:hypothetical protein